MTLEDKLIYLTFAANYCSDLKEKNKIVNELTESLINFLHDNEKGEGVSELMCLAFGDTNNRNKQFYWKDRINEIIKS